MAPKIEEVSSTDNQGSNWWQKKNQDYDKFSKSTGLASAKEGIQKAEQVKKQLADLEESKKKQLEASNNKAVEIKRQMEELKA